MHICDFHTITTFDPFNTFHLCMCVGKKKHLDGRLIATRQSTLCGPLTDVAGKHTDKTRERSLAAGALDGFYEPTAQVLLFPYTQPVPIRFQATDIEYGHRYCSTTPVRGFESFHCCHKLNRNWIPKSEDFVPVSVHCVVCACEPREDVGCIGIAEVDDLNTDYAR